MFTTKPLKAAVSVSDRQVT